MASSATIVLKAGSKPIEKSLFRRMLLIASAAAIVGAVVYAFLPQPVPVDTAIVERGLLRVTVDEDGKTRIKEPYTVSAPLAGRLLRIGLDPGDAVTAGSTVIARIEPTDPALLDPRARAEAQARVKAAEARLQRASADLDRAAAALQYAESDLARTRELYEKGTVSEDRLEQKQLAQRTASVEYRAAQFNEEIARFELEVAKAALVRTEPDGRSPAEDWYFEIRAPITGRVLRVFRESTTIVSPGDPLLELGDPLDLEVVVDVLSSDAVKIRPGAAVFLEQWGGEKPLRGTVRLVEPSGFLKVSALGVEEQRVNVVVDFQDPPEVRSTLGDGFRVEARIVVWEKSGVLKVPIGALFRRQDRWAVFVVDQGRARLQRVEVGQRGRLEAEVLKGLSENDRVIVYPSDKVHDGVRVRARPSTAND